MRFPSCRLQHTQRTACDAIKKKLKYAMHVARRLKTQRTQPILSLRPLYFSCACIAVFFLSALHDQHALRTLCWAAWKLTFKSVFIGLHTVSKLSYATHAMQSQCMHAKKRNASNQFYALRVCVHCVFRLRTSRFFICVA